jgi:hypothetical protein
MTTYDDADEIYAGYENPEQVYDVLANLPVTYTGAWQTRQFGAGDANALRPGQSVLTALANPPTAMVDAANNDYLAGGNYPVTPNDKNRYYPAT